MNFYRSDILVECLVPDFQGKLDCAKTIVDSGLDVYAHNIETVERLTPFVRDRRARYKSVAYLILVFYAKSIFRYRCFKS